MFVFFYMGHQDQDGKKVGQMSLFFFKSQRLLITNLVAFFNGKKATRKLEASL